ncbi:O-antigen ligase family protein [Vibrio inusitatus]|nr:O-antigen ligase family protein [Vibrio inusitatus]
MKKIFTNRNNVILNLTLFLCQSYSLLIIFSGMWLHSRHEKLLIIPLIIWCLLSLMKHGAGYYLKKIKEQPLLKFIFILFVISNLIDILGYGFLHSTFVRGTSLIFVLSVLYDGKKYKNDTIVIIVGLCILPSIIYCLDFYLENSRRPENIINPNSFSILFSMSAIYFLFVDCSNRKVIIFKYSLALICIICVIIMYSRASLLSMLLTIVFIALMKYRHNIQKLLFSIFVLISISMTFYYSGFTDKIVSKTEQQLSILGKNMNSPDGFRLQAYMLGYELIKEKPILGWGNNIRTHSKQLLNNEPFTVGYKKFFNNSKYPHFHNMYIDVAVRFGLPVFFLFLASIYSLLKRNILCKNILFSSYIMYFLIIGIFDSIFIFGTSLLLLTSFILITRGKNES